MKKNSIATAVLSAMIMLACNGNQQHNAQIHEEPPMTDELPPSTTPDASLSVLNSIEQALLGNWKITSTESNSCAEGDVWEFKSDKTITKHSLTGEPSTLLFKVENDYELFLFNEYGYSQKLEIDILHNNNLILREIESNNTITFVKI